MIRRLSFLFVLIALLAACGGAPRASAPTPTAAPDPTHAPAATTEAFPVTIEHKYGTTEIPRAPTRVVSVGFNDQDAILALGVVPVGIRDWYGEQPYAVWPWAQDKLGGATPQVLPANALNFEQIAALKPDLIIGISSGMTEQEYAMLSKIAPTIAQSGAYIDYGMPWQEQTRVIGRALGRSEQAEALVAKVEGLFADARAQNPAFAGASAVVAVNFNNAYAAYGPQDVRGRLLTSLGFTIPQEIADLAGNSFFASISNERLDLIDTDVLVIAVSTEAERAVIESDPLFQQLNAVRQGRVVFLDKELSGAASFSSVLSLPYLLERFVPLLAAAVSAGNCPAGRRLFDHELLATEPVCIPNDPQRIIALDMASVEMTLLANKTLLATSGWILSEFPLLHPPFAETLAGVEDVGYPANLEKVALLKPDLILAVGGTRAGDTIDAEQAQQIAPLVLADPVIYNDWKLGMRLWADVLNVPAFYEAMEANYLARVGELRTALGDTLDREISVISVSSYDISLWMPDTPPGAILSDVGLARPESQRLVGDEAIAKYSTAQYVVISPERLDLADGDVIFYFTYASTDPETAAKERDAMTAFEQHPVWQSLDAVKAGQAFRVPEYWWRSQTYLLANKVLDDLFTYLTDTSATTPVLQHFNAR